jgi:hypothetical protein
MSSDANERRSAREPLVSAPFDIAFIQSGGHLKVMIGTHLCSDEICCRPDDPVLVLAGERPVQ